MEITLRVKTKYNNFYISVDDFFYEIRGGSIAETRYEPAEYPEIMIKLGVIDNIYEYVDSVDDIEYIWIDEISYKDRLDYYPEIEDFKIEDGKLIFKQ